MATKRQTIAEAFKVADFGRRMKAITRATRRANAGKGVTVFFRQTNGRVTAFGFNPGEQAKAEKFAARIAAEGRAFRVF